MSLSTQAKIGIIGPTLSTRWGPRQRPRHYNIRPACLSEMRSRPLQLSLYQEQTSSMGSTTCWTADHLHLHRVHQCLGPQFLSDFVYALPCSLLGFVVHFLASWFHVTLLPRPHGSCLESGQLIFRISHVFLCLQRVEAHSRSRVYPPFEFGTDCAHRCGYHFTRCHTCFQQIRCSWSCGMLSRQALTHLRPPVRTTFFFCSCIGSPLADGCLLPAGFRSLFFVFGCGIRRPSIVDNVIQLGFVCHVFCFCTFLKSFLPCARCLSVVCAGLSSIIFMLRVADLSSVLTRKPANDEDRLCCFLILMPFSLLIFQLTHQCPPSEEWIGFG